MKKLTPKGMRDFLPQDMIFRDSVVRTIESVYKRYGFVPLETPAMEYIDTLKAKAGEAIKREIFLLEGGEYGLRFDLTVPLARVAATNAFTKPFKRYCISRVWRHEEPQKGRFREFWQCDVDIIGSTSMRAEAEVLACAYEAVKALGFERPKILINNRKIMNGLARKLNVEGKVDELLRILDKMDKIGEEGVRKHLMEHFSDEVIDMLFTLIKTTGSNAEKIEAARALSEEGAEELHKIIEISAKLPIEVDLSLVRGLGYYTGPVFEIKLSDEMGSCAGGGRYDNLLATYGQADSAVGISLGLERIIALLLERESTVSKTYTRVFVALASQTQYEHASMVVTTIRNADIPAEIDLNERTLKKQLEYAHSMGIRFVIVIGDREAQSKQYTLKDMIKGTNSVGPLGHVIKEIQNNRE